MKEKSDLERLLRELLGNNNVKSYSLGWVLGKTKATEDSIREIYHFLKDHKLTNEKIPQVIPLFSICCLKYNPANSSLCCQPS